MAQYRVVLLPGDGIGPEITAVARQLLDVVAHWPPLEHELKPLALGNDIQQLAFHRSAFRSNAIPWHTTDALLSHD